jgi:hypothetical protein
MAKPQREYKLEDSFTLLTKPEKAINLPKYYYFKDKNDKMVGLPISYYGTLLKKILTYSQPITKEAVVYLHSFGTVSFSSQNPYIVQPQIKDKHVCNSSWDTNNPAGLSSVTGFEAGLDKSLYISNNASGRTVSLYLDINAGFSFEILFIQFKRFRSSTGSTSQVLNINGTNVAVISTGSSSTWIDTGEIGTNITALTGTVIITLSLNEGAAGGSFRIDDFKIFGKFRRFDPSATICIAGISPPIITSSLTANGLQNTAFSYQIIATESPTSYSATGLPTGLSINTSTGLISGTPTTSGNTNVTISATNSGGTGSIVLSIVVDVPGNPPVISSALTATGFTGTSFSYQIVASENPTSFNYIGSLPAGLSLNTSTGFITGTPTIAGTSSITISATNLNGTDSETLVITIVSVSQMYSHSFGIITITGKPYTVAPDVINANLSSSQWDTNHTGFTSYAGQAGQALSISSSAGTKTYTLTFTVNPGMNLNISSLSFWQRRSSSGAQNFSLSINGVSQGSGSISLVGAVTSLTSLTQTSNLTGAVTIVITLTGATGSGTYRLDNFIINGFVL